MLLGTPAVERDTGLVPSDSSPIDAMCEVTGGRSYCITSHRMLNQCIDSLVQKVQNGVVINFEKIGPDPPPPQFDKDEAKDDNFEMGENDRNPANVPHNTLWHNCRKMIYVPKNNKYCVGEFCSFTFLLLLHLIIIKVFGQYRSLSGLKSLPACYHQDLPIRTLNLPVQIQSRWS